jgi:glycyl-tRNA synthetase beta chain
LATYLAQVVGADGELVAKAASLCKADLASFMVGEFPELQGVMGGYYADAALMAPDIATAIREHYRPQGPSDSVPSTLTGAIVALADKLDTLVSFFNIEEIPTGSRDPYALRRSTLGIVRILNVNKFRVSIIDAALRVNNGSMDVSILDEILDFFNDRLKVQWREDGYDFEAIDAVLSLKDDDLVRAQMRLDALQSIVKNDRGDNLLAAFKRANNILLAEAKKGALPEGEPNAFTDAPAVESALLAALNTAKMAMATASADEDFTTALAAYASLRSPLDAFLDGVLVNAQEPEIRSNRLKILRCVTKLCENIADISKFK